MKYPNNVRIALILAIGATMVFGCNKEDASPGTPVPPVANENPLVQVFANNRANAVQHFTINTDNGLGYVNGAHGLYAAFEQHAFLKSDGSVATGTIDINLVEAFHVGDMLWLNTQTIGLQNGQLKLLVSGGQFQLTASQNGESLSLRPNMSYISVPAQMPLDPDMALFSGKLQEDGTMVWDPWAINPLNNGSADSSGYSFPNDSLGWINCDYFYGGGEPLTGVQVTCPVEYDHDNTFVWIVFPDLNSLTSMGGGTNNLFDTGTGYEMPIGLNITVVALAQVDGAYFSSFTDAVVADGLNLNITLAPTTLEQFEVDAGGL